MPALTFSKWSPGGNTTLLFPDAGQRPAEQARLASLALDSSMLGGEQAGFVNLSQHKLRMAGGEFCVNASRAVGALLAYTAQYSGPEQGVLDGIAPRSEQKTEAAAPAEHPVRLDEIQVSGWQTPVRLRTRGSAPLWQVEALLRLPEYSITTIGKGAHLVRLPGICHLLLGGATHPLPDDCHAVAAQLRQQHGLEAEPAAGVIWWRECQGLLDMLPLVHVRDAGTTFLENACGSGALALALCLARAGTRRTFSIMQPGGSALDVRLFAEGGLDMAGIDGPVSLVARGKVWLPDPDSRPGLTQKLASSLSPNLS
ncbi:hypothetical protein [uncultured Desulfovibrio sp.]|uniref:hypothetical protein n=1 Tax=uncultured Desulfovibrio sp. TaxID=167968 RepID=UPI00261D8E12|nr:hypothetical protein [uncultured Desulfovibrio sp.]